MLNKDNIRELAYVVTIDEIKPIAGKDRVECAMVGGWSVMVRKDQFKPGDPAVYFEIDSKCPEKEPFTFLAAKHYRIKTQKYKTSDGYFFSQGLLMSARDLDWIKAPHPRVGIIDDDAKLHEVGNESRFLTKKLGITYASDNDNRRKAPSKDKYKSMAQRHGKLFSHQPYRWLMKRDWGKKLLFLFYGKKRDKRSAWPYWIPKTDEERIENLPHLFEDKSPWIVTEKIDGTSTTFAMEKKLFGRYKFYVCSRNVVFDKPDKKCFYETNVYTEMAEKYNIEEVLKTFLKNNRHLNRVILQGETYGAGIQKNDYGMKDRDIKIFNLITDEKKYENKWNSTNRWSSIIMKHELEETYNIPCISILDTEYILPDTIDELRAFVDSEPSKINGEMKEGIVFRSPDGTRSFKCVSPNYLAKYHG